jgi:hypothetical protein
MRVLKFDREEIAKLTTLGFTIDPANEVARSDGSMRIEVIRPDNAKHFDLMIELPNGSALACCLTRVQLAQAVATDDLIEDDDEDEDDDEAA